MNGPAAQIVLSAYYLVLGTLAVFGAHRLWLLALYYRTRSAHRRPAPPDPTAWPRVTVQLPLYNELFVAERLIRAVCEIDYPTDRFEVQVLDDSDDETAGVVAAEVERWRGRGIDILHLRREDRVGYKAGALAAGLERASGELIAVFDADFVPPPDFLRRVVPYLTGPGADSSIGMVQACWEHLNRDFSLLTRVQGMLLDAHFLIEHAARSAAGRLFNFNGTAGIWRRQAIVDAGGWQHDTLTEDLDLSYRAQLAGWRFLFLPGVKVPAELPVDVHAFKRQQFRWAKGSVQTARKLLARVLAARLPLATKIEAVFHLASNVCYPLMIGLSLLIFPAMVLRWDDDPLLLLRVDLPLFVFATLSVLAYFLASQIERGAGWQRPLGTLIPLMGLGIGLAVNNSRAVVEGLRREVGAFERTPKYRIGGPDGRDGAARRGFRYRVTADRSALAEGLFAAFFVGCFALAGSTAMWESLPFLWLFLHGYSYMLFLSLESELSS
jgi:cellulose synthase/poly-beta-1,6-N-acetylglucosamine synthase-like glycosyltransferase